jgi:hypothetical protein
MTIVTSGLPEDRSQFDMKKYFKVIERESSIKEETVNDRIQREGADCWGGGSEADWYYRNKGYSERIVNEC